MLEFLNTYIPVPPICTAFFRIFSKYNFFLCILIPSYYEFRGLLMKFWKSVFSPLKLLIHYTVTIFLSSLHWMHFQISFLSFARVTIDEQSLLLKDFQILHVLLGSQNQKSPLSERDFSIWVETPTFPISHIKTESTKHKGFFWRSALSFRAAARQTKPELQTCSPPKPSADAQVGVSAAARTNLFWLLAKATPTSH